MIDTYFSGIFGIIIGTLLGFLLSLSMWQIQKINESKNLAFALKLELEQIGESLIELVKVLEKHDLDNLDVVPQSFYPTSGLYYCYQVKIAFFPKKLAEKSFYFYINLLQAEEQRKLICSIKEKYWNESFSKQEAMTIQKELNNYADSITENIIHPYMPVKYQMKFAGIKISSQMRFYLHNASEMVTELKKSLDDYSNRSAISILVNNFHQNR